MQSLSNEEILFNVATNSTNLRGFSVKINLLLLGIITLRTLENKAEFSMS